MATQREWKVLTCTDDDAEGQLNWLEQKGWEIYEVFDGAVDEAGQLTLTILASKEVKKCTAKKLKVSTKKSARKMTTKGK